MNSIKIVEQSHDYHPYDHRLEIISTCSKCNHTKEYTELHEQHVQIATDSSSKLSVSITCIKCGNVNVDSNPEWTVIDNEYIESNGFGFETNLDEQINQAP